ncbi:MAG: tRNA uridine-5-carboxymethylaminomethyl(34) synthesis GTPase MnmE [Clostridia bacterium]|nr:tRNA uridine-5-carboxymethylaminomethyl(34) synthesis GTPase MnmE [Clostridia bacterium]
MEDTIAAIATAYGEGGIGIVRISGEKSFDILSRIFCTVNKSGNAAVNDGVNLKYKPFDFSKDMLNRKLTYGYIKKFDTDEIIDEVMAVYMKKPHTYTREDVVEIDCHGSIISLKKILEEVISLGARLAEPGEFTKRAFLNGRLDLSQAEAVIDMIRAKTDTGYDAALSQLSGELSKSVSQLRADILDILVNVTVNIEYPDEDIEELQYSDLQNRIDIIVQKLVDILKRADEGRIIREGLSVAIVGKPNVGKSSLMNALLREPRAIVTDIPGTTRDTIEEFINISGIPVRLTDTAGIRETDNPVEKIGIQKSRLSFEKADLVLFVIDRAEGLSGEDIEIAESVKNKKVIVLLNKSDLTSCVTDAEIGNLFPNADIISTSMESGEGIEKIKKAVYDMVFDGRIRQENSVLVTNVRHKSLLESALSSLKDAAKLAEIKESFDIIEIDIRNAYDSLGEIIGESVSDDIINEVFSRFCLGK